MFQGWAQKGRRGQIGSPYHAREEEKEIVGPTKPMKQIGKRKSEKGKLSISSSPDQLTRGKTVWHITPPDSRDPLKSVSNTSGQSGGSSLIAKTSASPTRKLSSIPPPPSNPPPILDRAKISDSKEEIKESEPTKSVQANAAKSTAPTVAKESANMLTGHGAVKQSVAGGREGVGGRGGRVGGAERKSPPKHPPPQSAKAKAAAVVTTAIQDHMQSSTRSAPGKLQSAVKMEGGVPEGGSEGGRESTKRVRTESAGNKLVVGGRNADKGKPLPHPSIRPEITALTSSGGGVKNLARFFSARSKENTSTAEGGKRDLNTAGSPIRSPIPRGPALEEKRGKITDKSVLPSDDGRTPSEMRDHATGKQSQATTSGSSPDADNDYQKRKMRKRSFSGSKRRQPLSIPSLDEEPEERYERLMSITSSVSNSSPTHTTPSSWYSRSYQNVFSDPAFARFDKRDPTLNLSPSSPTVPFSANSVTHNYQNVFDDENFARFNKTETADKGKKEEGGEVKLQNGKSKVDKQRLTEDERGDSDSEGSLKEKKPKPLPRKSSQDSILGSLSNSEGSLSTLSPLAATEDPAGVYEDMQSHVASKLDPVAEEKLRVEVQGLQAEGREGGRRKESSGTTQLPDQPEMIVLGAQDPEWMENYAELIEQEIDMLGEFDDDFSFQLSYTPWNRESALLDGNEGTRVAQESEEKSERKGDGNEMIVPVRKTSLAKAVSHSPQGRNIHRRNTPKEKRELRQGICSADDRLDSRRDSDLDDYIPMNPVRLSTSSQTVSLTPSPSPSHSTLSQPKPQSQPMPSQSLLVPGPSPGMDPRSSTYYLKILPYDSPTPSSQATSTTQPSSSTAKPTTTALVKHQYIDIDIPDEPTEVFVPFQRKEGKAEAANEGSQRKESTQAVSGTGASPPKLASTRRKLKYSQVEVVPGKSKQNRIIEDRAAGPRGITKYSQVKVGADAASESPPDESSSSPKLKRSQGSVFAKEMMKYINRPLPPTPEGNIYYKTITHPLPHVPPMRTPVWHEYVEIDEDELNKKKGNVPTGSPGPKRNFAKNGGIAALKAGEKEPVASGTNEQGSKERKNRSRSATPPPVPVRPSCPYVEIDGKGMEEMAKSLPSSSILAALKQKNKALSPSPPDSEDNNVTPKEETLLHSQPSRVARKMGPPPEIPKRPEVFSRERSFSSSGEYSYAMVPGMKFQWLKMQPRHEDGQGYFVNAVPGPSSHPGRNPSLHAKKNLMATISEMSTQEKRKSDRPPSVPPKTESLLREQGLLLANYGQKPSPYLVPIASKKRKMSSPAIFNLSTFATSAGHSVPRSPKEVVSDMRKELLLEEEQKRGGKGASSGSDRGSSSPEHSKPWKQSPPPPRPPPPKLTQNARRAQSPGSMSNGDRWDQSPKKGRKQSGEESKISSTAGGNVKSLPTKLTPEHREEVVATTGAQKYNREGEGATESEVSPEFLRLRRSGMQQYINRNSLALIMQNKEAIERQLMKERGDKVEEGRKIQEKKDIGGERVKQSSSSTSQAAGVRGLGEILLEVDSLLQQHVCSEEDLIAAMEEQLKIKLQPVKQGSRERGKEQDERQEEGREECDISIQITQADVDEVVSFMNENQTTHTDDETGEMGDRGRGQEVTTAEGMEMTDSAETERNSVLVKSDYDLQDSEDLPFSPKQRSSTFVIIDDADIPTWRQQWQRRKAANDIENDNSLALRFGGAGHRTGVIPEELMDSSDPERTRPGQKRFGAEGDFAMSPEENMRDSRSFSLGPKPLRRVNARRRTNPASDMHNISLG